MQHTGVDGLARSGDGLKVELVTTDLYHHESAIGVEAGGHNGRSPAEVAVAQLT